MATAIQLAAIAEILVDSAATIQVLQDQLIVQFTSAAALAETITTVFVGAQIHPDQAEAANSNNITLSFTNSAAFQFLVRVAGFIHHTHAIHTIVTTQRARFGETYAVMNEDVEDGIDLENKNEPLNPNDLQLLLPGTVVKLTGLVGSTSTKYNGVVGRLEKNPYVVENGVFRVKIWIEEDKILKVRPSNIVVSPQLVDLGHSSVCRNS